MFKINVKVVPNARKSRVEEGEDKFKIYVTAQAIEGKANSAMIKLLSKHFNVKKSDVKIVRGEKSREKVVEINKEA